MNTRGAQMLSSDQWDRSVLRMKTVDPEMLMQTSRSEFRFKKMFLIVFFSAKGRIQNRFRNLASKLRGR